MHFKDKNGDRLAAACRCTSEPLGKAFDVFLKSDGDIWIYTSQ